MEALHCFGCAGHISPLSHSDDIVVGQHLGFLAVNLILSGTRKSDVDWCVPQSIQVRLWLGCSVLYSLKVVCVLLDSTSPVILQVHYPSELLPVDPR